MKVTVRNPRGKATGKAQRDPTWALEDKYVVARGAPRRTVSEGPMRKVKIHVTMNEGGRRTESVDEIEMPSRTRSVPGGETICPIFGDKVPYKSVTVVVDAADADAAAYSLEFVLGGGAVSKTKRLPDGRVALRGDYMAW